MKKIIIIQHEPLTPNIENKFCINELITAGFDLEYWDISQLIYPGLTLSDKKVYEYLRIIYAMEDFQRLWNNLPENCVAITECFYISETRKIWEILRSRRIPLIRLERYANTDLDESFFKKLIAHLSPKKIIQFLKNANFRHSMKKIGITSTNRYDYYLTSGNKSKCDCKINHPDYDDFLMHKNDEPYLRERYICYVDVGFGIHPDEKYFMHDIHMSNEKWQLKLSTFFTEIEKKYGIPVVIAVHPKIGYSDDAFGGRRKIKYQTLNLVLNAEFVLQDISNSLAFSILANKKIGLIATKDFLKIYKNYLVKISQKIGIPIFNIDKQRYTDFEARTVNEILRKSYIESYLCTEDTKNELTSDILIKFLSTL